MLPSKRNDFRVVPHKDLHGNARWKIMIGRTETATICQTKQEAIELAKNLNLDPWYLERGQTREERVAAWNAHEAKKKLTNT